MPERHANVPDFALSVAGQDFTVKARPRLISLSLTEKRGGEADQLDIVLDDADGRLALPPKGAIITLRLGWRQGSDVRAGLIDKGRFTVDETTWEMGSASTSDHVTIRARSADLAGRFRARRERAHTDTTLGAIARRVAADNGLEASIAADLDGAAVPALEQHQQSDMALLRRLGRRHDAVATVKDRRLILSPIGRGASVSGRALAPLILTRALGSGGRFAEVDRSADAGVEARYHDQDTGERHTVRAGSGTGTPRRLRRVHHSRADAERAARSEAGRARRAEASFDFTLPLGRPDLLPETPVTLQGFKPAIDARSWIVAELTHKLERSSALTTGLKLETR